MKNERDARDDHRVIKQLTTGLRVIKNLGISIMLIMFFFISGPIVEGSFFPVIKDMKSTYEYTLNGVMYFHVTANKRRDCRFIESRALVDKSTRDSNPPVQGTAWNTTPSTRVRSLGNQDMGIWAVVPEGDQVLLEVVYSCHPFWDTHQQVGVWEK